MSPPRSNAVPITLLSAALGFAGCAADHDAQTSKNPRNRGQSSSLAFVPDFPGAGLSGADEPLADGMVCDTGTRVSRTELVSRTSCFFQPGKPQPAATIEQVLECAEGVDAVRLRLTFDPAFVDNTYGANSIGWDQRKGAGPMAGGMLPVPPPAAAPPPSAKMPKAPKGPGPGMKGHTWKDLVGSDHAEFVVTNEANELALQFKLDYVSVDPSAPSGYASLGVVGGDGRMIKGDSKAIVRWTTSIDRNLNERGYGDFIEDSPETDADYTPNAATPNWDYRVVYEVWIDNAAFGASGFGGASIEHVHASPSKAPSNTIIVTEDECPCQRDGGCDTPPPPDKECGGLDDFTCTMPEVPPPPAKEPDCDDHPEDPNCALE
jgi:hypothetical protein